MSSGIYEIVNVKNGRRYVGSAVNISKRWGVHKCGLRKGKHHSRNLQSAWLKYGESAFEIRPVLLCDKSNLLLYEQIVMDALVPEYNVLKVAGNSTGRKATDETRAKISAKALGKKRSPESVERGAAKRRGVKLSPEHAAQLRGNKYALGTVHTDERKAAISEFMTGRPRPKSAEHRAKLSTALLGRKPSDEARASQSASQLGKKRGPYKPMSEETKARALAIRRSKPNAGVGLRHSAASRALMSETRKGRKCSPEHASRIGAATARRWADPETREQWCQSMRIAHISKKAKQP